MVEVPDSTTRYIQSDSGKPTKDLFNWMKSISSSLARLIDTDAADQSAWTAFTPTITASAGTFTSISAAGRYKQTGKTVFFRIIITVTTNGTASGFVISTLPVTAQAGSSSNSFYGRTQDGRMLQGIVITTATFAIQTYDGLYPATSGQIMTVNGTYEAA